MTKSYTFEEVETVRCPKCASGPGCRCWVMAGKGCTSRSKTIPHMERAIAFIEERDVVEAAEIGGLA